MPEISSTSPLGDRIAKARAEHGLSAEPGPRPTGRGRPKKAKQPQPWWKRPEQFVPYLALALVGYLMVSGLIANAIWFLM